MDKQKTIVEKLSQFNNLSFTKKQWDIILKGCGCPKSCYFWAALRMKNLIKKGMVYTLVDIDSQSYSAILENYCKANRASVKRAYEKNKARKQVIKRRESFKSITFYLIGGTLTTNKPERD